MAAGDPHGVYSSHCAPVEVCSSLHCPGLGQCLSPHCGGGQPRWVDDPWSSMRIDEAEAFRAGVEWMRERALAAVAGSPRHVAAEVIAAVVVPGVSRG